MQFNTCFNFIFKKSSHSDLDQMFDDRSFNSFKFTLTQDFAICIAYLNVWIISSIVYHLNAII